MRQFFSLGFILFLMIVIVVKSFAVFDYTIIIDAGSSGTRLHVYRYQRFHRLFLDTFIKEIYKEKLQHGLSDYVNHPEMAGPALKPMLDHALKALKHQAINPSGVSIHVLGTAGMRQLSTREQTEIYAQVKEYIQSHYPFDTENGYFRTITGQNEGIFSWVDINYLLNQLLWFRKTTGMLDMGGQSTQFTVSIPRILKDKFNSKRFIVDGKVLNVFSKTFLRFGADAMRDDLSKSPEFSACYPSGFNENGIQGQFDFNKCSNFIYGRLTKMPELDQVPHISNWHYIAVGGFYWGFQFFHYHPNMTEKDLKENIIKICGQSWSQMKKKYPKQFKLDAQCPNMMYFYELLFDFYDLKLKQIKFVNKIDGFDTSWTRGALIYVLENKL